MTTPVQQLALVQTYVDPADGLTKVRDSIRLTPGLPVFSIQGLDLGFPEVRASSQDNPGADGTLDETQFTGARSVAITGAFRGDAFGDEPTVSGWDAGVQWNSTAYFARYLAGWASPARRSRIYFTDDSGISRYLDVRGDSFISPIDPSSAAYRPFQLGFVNPSGKIYSFSTDPAASPDGRNRQLIRQSSINLPGRPYPIAGPYRRIYPVVVGTEALSYAGAVANGFVAKVYTAGSAMTAPRITVTSPDGVVQSIGISGYTIPKGQVVTFDTTAKTITTSTGLSLEAYKTAPLQWPTLRPGITSSGDRGYNLIGFQVATGDPAAYVEILWNDADLM